VRDVNSGTSSSRAVSAISVGVFLIWKVDQPAGRGDGADWTEELPVLAAAPGAGASGRTTPAVTPAAGAVSGDAGRLEGAEGVRATAGALGAASIRDATLLTAGRIFGVNTVSCGGTGAAALLSSRRGRSVNTRDGVTIAARRADSRAAISPSDCAPASATDAVRAYIKNARPQQSRLGPTSTALASVWRICVSRSCPRPARLVRC
jgi:hypothetical protein